jgi:transposase-like protein
VRCAYYRCRGCDIYFAADTSHIAPKKSRYSKSVIAKAMRMVTEEHLSYREASKAMWNKHIVKVPFATIQNWVEAARI